MPEYLSKISRMYPKQITSLLKDLFTTTTITCCKISFPGFLMWKLTAFGNASIIEKFEIFKLSRLKFTLPSIYTYENIA